MSQYVYHYVPENMVGNILYPLNQLASKLPAVYKQELGKYSQRKKLLKRKVPLVDCLWNDLLHFCPVGPQQIMDEFKKYGSRIVNPSFFKIDVVLFESKNTLIYPYKDDPANYGDLLPQDVTSFTKAKLKSYSILPKETKEYYREYFETDHNIHNHKVKGLYLYHFVPHVLYKGTIDTSNALVSKITLK